MWAHRTVQRKLRCRRGWQSPGKVSQWWSIFTTQRLQMRQWCARSGLKLLQEWQVYLWCWGSTGLALLGTQPGSDTIAATQQLNRSSNAKGKNPNLVCGKRLRANTT